MRGSLDGIPQSHVEASIGREMGKKASEWLDELRSQRQASAAPTTVDQPGSGDADLDWLSQLPSKNRSLKVFHNWASNGTWRYLLGIQLGLGLIAQILDGKIREASGGVGCMDLTFGQFTVQEFYEYIAKYGEDGRWWWAAMELYEYVYMCFVAAFWCTVGAWVCRGSLPLLSRGQYIALVPLLVAMLDAIENFSALVILASLPVRRYFLVVTYSWIIAARWTAFAVFMCTMVACGSLMLVERCARLRKQDRGDTASPAARAAGSPRSSHASTPAGIHEKAE